MGVHNQEKRKGLFTGRKLLGFYESILCLTLALEIYVFYYAYVSYKALSEAYSLVQSGSVTQPFTDFEEFISTRFNTFFFGAASKCKVLKYAWFWSWIDDNCPTTRISTELCDRCNEYTLTACYADQSTCNADSTGFSDACPYKICREGFLTYFMGISEPAAYALLALLVFQMIMMIVTGLLMCYHHSETIRNLSFRSLSIRVPNPNKTNNTAEARARASKHKKDAHRYRGATENEHEQPPPGYDEYGLQLTHSNERNI